jgi:hypothetical protein
MTYTDEQCIEAAPAHAGMNPNIEKLVGFHCLNDVVKRCRRSATNDCEGKSARRPFDSPIAAMTGTSTDAAAICS